MSGFLYFKPGATVVTPESVKEWGLGYAFSDRVAGTRCQSSTPTGAAGLVFADKTRVDDIRMDVANQEWFPHPIRGTEIRVGYWKKAKPTPAELARAQQIPGYLIPLADGVKWSIPLVRRFDVDSAALVSAAPCYMTCDADGNWIPGKVKEAHAALWELVTPFADDMMAQSQNDDYVPRDFQPNELFGAAATLLQTNYVVGPTELALLGAFLDDDSAISLIFAACDLPTFWRWNEDQKKTEQPLALASESTNAGEAA